MDTRTKEVEDGRYYHDGIQPAHSKGDKRHMEDPFGDETHSQVKYKTMKWWYVFASSHLLFD